MIRGIVGKRGNEGKRKRIREETTRKNRDVINSICLCQLYINIPSIFFVLFFYSFSTPSKAISFEKKRDLLYLAKRSRSFYPPISQFLFQIPDPRSQAFKTPLWLEKPSFPPKSLLETPWKLTPSRERPSSLAHLLLYACSLFHPVLVGHSSHGLF